MQCLYWLQCHQWKLTCDNALSFLHRSASSPKCRAGRIPAPRCDCLHRAATVHSRTLLTQMSVSAAALVSRDHLLYVSKRACEGAQSHALLCMCWYSLGGYQHIWLLHLCQWGELRRAYYIYWQTLAQRAIVRSQRVLSASSQYVIMVHKLDALAHPKPKASCIQRSLDTHCTWTKSTT